MGPSQPSDAAGNGARGCCLFAGAVCALAAAGGGAWAVLFGGEEQAAKTFQALRSGQAFESVGCPKGYNAHDGHIIRGGKLEAIGTIQECVDRCEDESNCFSVEFSPSEKLCILNTLGGSPEVGRLRDFQFCEKPSSSAIAKILYGPEEYVEQEGAQIPPGGNVRIYVMGSSNVLWMTWIDQLHLLFLRLGYKVPVVPAKTNATHFPSEPQTCDDSQYFTALKTARLGKIGWHSWDFAYDNWNDCLEDSSDNYGYRYISNYKVKCEHGPGCHFGRAVVPEGGLAEDASWSDITLITTWFNDDQPDALKCFYGRKIPRRDIANMSIAGLLRTTRSIHARNPDVWVVILAKYSNLRHYKTEWIDELHRIIKGAVEKEPRTLFVDYDQPHPGNWVAWELWQKAHPNHPNCRGSKLMAHSVVQRLFQEKIIGRTIKLVDRAKNVNARNCDELHGAVCHTSVLCWVDPEDNKCKPYSGGSKQYYKHEALLNRETPTSRAWSREWTAAAFK